MEAFDVPVRLRPAHLRPAVLDLLKLEEQLVGVLVLPAAELAPAVVQDLDAVTGIFEVQSRAQTWRLKQSSTVWM